VTSADGTDADGTENRLLPSVQLIERVLATDVSYTISRMRVLERIPGNPIGIGYRRIDEKAVALVSVFLPAFRRVIGLRPGHEGEIEALVAWYRSYGVKPTFEIVPGMYDAALGRELARHGFLPSGFHAALIGEPDRSTQPNPDIDTDLDIERVVSDEATERYLDAYVAGWGVPDKDHAQFKSNVRPWRQQPGWSLYLARVDGRPAAAATLYVADRVAYLADATTAPAFRGRGLHAALLRQRIRDAGAAGVDFIFSGAEPMGTSHRNMERAGLRLYFHRTKWTAG
jgi:ribosomal protein S18 acetylase RimI-like enzyme